MYILDDPIDEHGNLDFAAFNEQWRVYREYLASLKGKIASATYEFATAEWHYNSRDHRCPHDAWVNTLKIEESWQTEPSHDRRLDIYLRLYGAYDDGYLDLTYKGVQRYSLQYDQSRNHYSAIHGDWLVDEIRLAEDGAIEHEIVFASEARWLIGCADIVAEWLPFNEEDRPGGRSSSDLY